MSNEQLKHIFDPSACLTAKQLKSYVSGSMVNEEAHTAEVHLLSCPMCADAVDGLKEHGNAKAIAAIDSLPKEFLAEHLGQKSVDEFLNIPAAPTKKSIVEEEPTAREKSFKNIRIWRVASVAAAIVLGLGALWLLRDVLNSTDNNTLAETVNIDKQAPKPATTYTAPIAMDTNVVDTTTVITEVIDTTSTIGVDTDEQLSEMQKTEVAKKEEAALVVKKEKEKNAAKEAAKKKALEKADKEKVAELAANADANEKEVRARVGNSYAGNIDGTLKYDNAEKPEEKAAAASPKDYTADELYKQKNYSAALAKYKKQMNSADREQRDEARLNISRCHIALGQNASAKAILQSLIDEGSSEKRKAKKLLKKLD